MTALVILILGLHASGIMIDEFYFHLRRGLPNWERWSHPSDTAVFLIFLMVVLLLPSRPHTVASFATVGLLSSLTITKDEWVHARLCMPGEHWLHSLLFIMHPIVLGALVISSIYLRKILLLEISAALAFFAYQITFWTFICRGKRYPTMR